MKFFILLFFTISNITALIGQDTSCLKLNELIKIQKDKKYSSRCLSKCTTNDMETIIEKDTFSNTHILTTMKINGREMKTEKITYFNNYYARINGSEWRLMNDEVARFEIAKNLSNSPLNPPETYKNCKQLEDETIADEKYLVFTAEMKMPDM